MRQLLESPNTATASGQQILVAIQEEEQALGITDDQYWTELAPHAYQRYLSIGRLRGKEVGNYQSLHQSTDSAELESVWESYVQQLRSNASITK